LGLCVFQVQRRAEDILAFVGRFRAANPQCAGVGCDELGTELKLNPDLLDAAGEWLFQSKQLGRNGTFLARAGWSSRLSDRDQKTCGQIAAQLQPAGFAPPSLKELATGLAEPPPRVSAMMKLLAECGVLVRLDDKIWMHRDAVEAGKAAALKLFRRKPAFSTMEFRDALGVSRKSAVPLVDYLDKIRFTVRNGNHRTPEVAAKKHLKPEPNI